MRREVCAVAVFAVWLMFTLPLAAQSLTTNGNFSVSNVNMWGPFGTSFSKTAGAGAKFGVALDIGGISCTDGVGCFGAQGGGSVFGSLGMNVSATISGGQVAADLPFTSVIHYSPVLQHNTSFFPTANFGFGNTSFSAGGAAAGGTAALVGSLLGEVHAQACAFSCVGAGALLFGTPNPFPNPPTPLNFNIPVLAAGSGLNGAGASGSGASPVTAFGLTDVAHVSVDLGALFTKTLGIPASGNIAGLIDYSLISGGANIDTYVEQKFTLTPAMLLDLHVQETGQDAFCFMGGLCQSIVTPSTGNQLTIIPKFIDQTAFETDTGIQFAPLFDVSLISASFTLPFNLSLGNIGPLGTFSNSTPFPVVNVLDTTFGLGGEFDGNPIVIQLADPQQPVPEPGTLVLLASGLLAGIGSLRRRLR